MIVTSTRVLEFTCTAIIVITDHHCTSKYFRVVCVLIHYSNNKICFITESAYYLIDYIAYHHSYTITLAVTYYVRELQQNYFEEER